MDPSEVGLQKAIAEAYVQAWQLAMQGEIPDGSSRMAHAISVMAKNIKHNWIRKSVLHALASGELVGASEKSMQQWKGLAKRNLAAAGALVVESARVKDHVDTVSAMRRKRQEEEE